MNWITNYVRPKLGTLLNRRETPDNLWVKCTECSQMIFHRELDEAQRVCPYCAHHMAIRPEDRFARLFDDGKFETIDPPDPHRRSAAIPRRETLYRPPEGREEENRARRRRADRHGKNPRCHVRRRRLRFRLHGRLNGHGRRRGAVEGRRKRGGNQGAADHVLRRWGRADAGGHPLADADAAHDHRRADGEGGRAALISVLRPIRPPAGSRRPTRCWAISISPSPTR